MLEVVLPRLLLGDRQLRSDLLALHLLDQHLALELFSQIVCRHALLREGLCLRGCLLERQDAESPFSDRGGGPMCEPLQVSMSSTLPKG